MKSKEVLRLEKEIRNWRKGFWILWILAVVFIIGISNYTAEFYLQAKKYHELSNMYCELINKQTNLINKLLVYAPEPINGLQKLSELNCEKIENEE